MAFALDAGSLALLVGIFHRLGGLRAEIDSIKRRIDALEEDTSGT